MRVIRCDQCGTEVNERSAERWDYLHVSANEDADHGELCSWACLATWSAIRALERGGVA